MTRLSPAVLVLLALPALAPAQVRIDPPPEYAPVVAALEPFIAREVADKKLPALSVALVDDQRIVWARGFGQARPGVPATAETVYRVGSVSKLFTDLAVMQLVEQGKLDLDAPVTKYLPDFKPISRFPTPITLRHLMSHRAGLVRETPVGNYFDASQPSLERTVRSLNQTELVHEPGTRTKYSNAGLAVVGRVVEVVQGQRFARHLHNRVLAPLGLTHTSFEPTLELNRDLAQALMWTYDGREFPAPVFELGTGPAGNLYSTALDLARFLKALFAGGQGPGGPVLQPATLARMYDPQDGSSFGLGFALADWEGHKRVGHSGAVYGFATELSALPQEKLGVAVIASRDVSNGVTRHIADEALRQLLALRNKKAPPAIAPTSPRAPDRARARAGRYAAPDGRALELTERDGRLYLLPLRGGFQVELRARGDDLVVDSPLAYGRTLRPAGDTLVLDKDTYTRVPDPKPADLPDKWRGLVGEYGPDHNTLVIFEKDGRLWALIEWVEFDPLERESDDVFRFPAATGMYHGEKIVFTRDASGKAVRAEAAGVPFERRPTGPDDGVTFRITPVRPVADLRREALKATPPVEKGDFLKPDLVDLAALDPTLKFDIRYASTDNFLGTPLYSSARAFLQRPAALALVRVHRALGKQGYGLLIHDAYRPWSVTRMFWDATPPAQHVFVADPAQGSRHNRGCAVDLTLYDRASGRPVLMPSGYDEMTPRAAAYYPGGTSRQREHRDILRHAMAAEGFTVYDPEWWHFDYKDWRRYPILNRPFEDLPREPPAPK